MPSDKRILYVEDEIIIALDTAETLEEMGFSTVEMAHSLRKARALASGQNFDQALLDVNLGNGENTLEFGRELMAKGVNVIFASGYNAQEMEAEHPGLVFIEKPLTPAAIVAALSRADVT